jgi:hypothetical protein
MAEKDFKDLKVGREFDVKQVETENLREQANLLKAKDRSLMLRVFLVGSILAMTVSFFGYGLVAFLKVWAFIAAPLGAVMAYLYRGRSQSDENDN